MGRRWLAIGSALAAIGLVMWLLPKAPPSRAAGSGPARGTATHRHEWLTASEASSSRQAETSTGLRDGKARVLVSNRQATVSVINPVSGRVLYRAHNGVASPTTNRIYGDAGNAFEIASTQTGQSVGRVQAPKGMELHVASTGGGRLAFARAEKHGASKWLPLGRSHTKITVVKTNAATSKRTYDLKGNYGIEAFSTDDRQLFLIKYMPARNPWHYGVRRLDLASGMVHEIARSKQNAPGEMNGTGRLSRFSTDGTELYTLYTQQGPNYTHVHPEDAENQQSYAFIHQLNLERAWTHCIDLPAPFGTGMATSHAMAVSDDGRLYVADPSSGGLAVVDTDRSLVLQSATAALRFLRKAANPTVSSDGTLYLAGRHKIKAFDGVSLRHQGTVTTHRRVSWIAARDSKLYVGTQKKILVFNPRTGRRLNG